MKLRLPKDWSWSYALGGFLVAISLAFAAIMVYASSQRELSSLERTLFQVVILGGGLSGSFLFGRMSALQAARDIIRPQARSAFRRARSLRRSLNALSTRIETMQKEEYDHRLALVHAVVNELTFVSQDALDDWRDVIPDDADDIMANTDTAPDRIDDLDEDDGDSLDLEGLRRAHGFQVKDD